MPNLNHTQAEGGKARAICVCCGRTSRPVLVDDAGEPGLWGLPRGWSQAPFPAQHRHRDGSTGSTYHCPECNNKARSGQVLQRRGQEIMQGACRVAGFEVRMV